MVYCNVLPMAMRFQCAGDYNIIPADTWQWTVLDKHVELFVQIILTHCEVVYVIFIFKLEKK